MKDSRIRAIIGINVHSIGSIGQSFLFKRAIATGVAVLDYQIIRNLSLIFVFSAISFFVGLKPLTRDFPHELKYTLFWRMVTGQAAFFIFNFCLTLIPLTYVIIIISTSGFWVSLLAWLLYKEQLILLEIAGLVICFIAVVVITLNGSKNSP